MGKTGRINGMDPGIGNNGKSGGMEPKKVVAVTITKII